MIPKSHTELATAYACIPTAPGQQPGHHVMAWLSRRGKSGTYRCALDERRGHDQELGRHMVVAHGSTPAEAIEAARRRAAARGVDAVLAERALGYLARHQRGPINELNALIGELLWLGWTITFSPAGASAQRQGTVISGPRQAEPLDAVRQIVAAARRRSS